MRKFAYELTEDDVLLVDSREVMIEEVNPLDADSDVDESTYVVGYYDDDGDDFRRLYGPDDEVVVK